MSENPQADKQFLDFIHLLTIKGKFKQIDQEWKKKKDSNEKIAFLEKIVKEFKSIPNFEEFKQSKDPVKSDLHRNEGNQRYRQKQFMDSLEFYNKSLCFAPPGSGIAGLAYANRSAAYLAMEYYEKALENIEFARKHHYPKDQLHKLKDREEKCLELMNNKPNKKPFQENEKIRNEVLKEQLPRNKRAHCYIADCLEVKKSPNFGRSIITNRDLEVGTVIAIEEPFSKTLLPESCFIVCANCLAGKLRNLLPCDHCCDRMFCSEECKKDGWEKFHQYECGIAGILDKCFTNTMRSSLRVFFEALSTFHGDPAALNNFLTSIEDSEATIFDFDFSKMGEIEKKKALLECAHAFSDSKMKHIAMNFVSTFDSAILCILMMNHSKLGSILNAENIKIFRRFIYKHCRATTISSAYSVSVVESIGEKIGSGIYHFNSLLNHSCVPNVTRIWFQTKDHVIVRRPIKAGQELVEDTDGISHVIYPVAERKARLMADYAMVCHCVACRSPAKFPCWKDSKFKDPNYLTFVGNDREYLCTGKSLERAHQIYKRFCSYLQENDEKNYPCQEICQLEGLAFNTCFQKFFLIGDE